jgi:hypothetical protein
VHDYYHNGRALSIKHGKRVLTLKDGTAVTVSGRLYSLDIMPGVELMVHKPVRGVFDGKMVTGKGFTVSEVATSARVIPRALTNQRLAIEASINRCSQTGAAAHVLAKVAEARRAAYMKKPHTERPMAAEGLTSYRYPGTYGWAMIGASSNADALREAARSTRAEITLDRLEVWSDATQTYVAATPSRQAS